MDELRAYQPDCKLLQSETNLRACVYGSIMRDIHTKIVMLNKNLLSALNLTCNFSVKSAFSQISQTKQNKTLPSHYGEKNCWQNVGLF